MNRQCLLHTIVLYQLAALFVSSVCIMSSIEHSETFEKIETLQQELITHIRTSGIRKPRETSLIDEVMDLRRETRRLFSQLNSKCSSLTDTVEKYRADIEEITSKRHEKQLEELQAAKNRMEELQKSKDALELKLREDMKTELEKNNFVHKLRFDKLRQKYEAAMTSLEAKLNDVTVQKKDSDAVDMETKLQHLLTVEKQKLEEQYLAKMKR